MVARLLLAAFLIGHAAIHTGFISPRPPETAGGPPWPFTLDSTWASSLGLAQPAARLVGVALVAIVMVGFALSALGALGVLPAEMWLLGTAVGAVASIGLLVLFFHPWLLLGLAIDFVLLWAVLVARWEPNWLAT